MYNHSYYPDYLQHHGIKGMKWGVRRFQNRDGSLTNAGQRRRDKGEQGTPTKGSGGSGGKAKPSKSKRLKKVLGVTLGAAAAAGLAYGGRKLYKSGALDGAISRLNSKSAQRLGSYGVNRSGNKLKSAYLGAKDRYKNSKLGRKIATEKFKYKNDIGGLANAKNRVVDTAYRVGERGALYGRKARSGLSNAANRAYEKGALYGRKARSGVVDTAYRVSERASLYGRKARNAAGNYVTNAKRRRKASKIRYKGF